MTKKYKLKKYILEERYFLSEAADDKFNDFLDSDPNDKKETTKDSTGGNTENEKKNPGSTKENPSETAATNTNTNGETSVQTTGTESNNTNGNNSNNTSGVNNNQPSAEPTGNNSTNNSNNAKNVAQNLATQKSKKDWATLLNNNKDDPGKLQSIWNEYYRTEWGTYAEKVKSLGAGFVQEVLELGFTMDLNPFIDFLMGGTARTYLPLKQFNLTANSYGALHNAFVENEITAEDLRGAGKVGTNNLIFCKELYSLNAGDIEKYLFTQKKDVLDKFDSTGQSKSIIIDDLKTATVSDLHASIFYKGGDPLKVVGDKPTVGDIKKGLNTLTNIKRWVTSIFGSATEYGDRDNTKIVTGIKDVPFALYMINGKKSIDRVALSLIMCFTKINGSQARPDSIIDETKRNVITDFKRAGIDTTELDKANLSTPKTVTLDDVRDVAAALDKLKIDSNTWRRSMEYIVKAAFTPNK